MSCCTSTSSNPSSSPSSSGSPCPEGAICGIGGGGDGGGEDGGGDDGGGNGGNGPGDDGGGNGDGGGNNGGGDDNSPPDDPTATPSPESECPPGNIRVPKGQGYQCVYCPPEYFHYNDTHQCYTRLNLNITHPQATEANPGPRVKVNDKDVPVFSPRDRNGLYDALNFAVQRGSITVNGTATEVRPGADYVKWRMALTKKDETLSGNGLWGFLGQGSASIPFTAWESGVCLKDNRYDLHLIAEQTVTVPDFDEPVPVTVLVNQEAGNGKQEFWIDNTPPVIQNLHISEIDKPTNPTTWETTVSFQLAEPKVNLSHSRLRYAPQNGLTYVVPDGLQPAHLRVYVDEVLLLNPASFGIASQLPNHLLTVTPTSERHATVSFTLPHRLQGHRIEVELEDETQNYGRYLLYPQGGF